MNLKKSREVSIKTLLNKTGAIFSRNDIWGNEESFSSRNDPFYISVCNRAIKEVEGADLKFAIN